MTKLDAAILLALLCGGAILAYPAAAPAPVQSVSEPPHAAVAQQRSVDRVASNPALLPVFDPARPDLAIATYRTHATAGSAEAMRELSRVLQQCAQLLAGSEDAVIARELQLAEFYRRYAQDTGRAYDAKAHQQEVEQKTADRLLARDRCRSIAPDEIAAWLAWLERAAIAGDRDAQEAYAGAILARTADPLTLFENIEEVARQKRLAYRFLRRIADSGNCMASGQLELLAPDAGTSYAFALVSVEMTRRFNRLHASPETEAQNVAFMQRQAGLRAAKLSVRQRRQAQALTRVIVANCR